MQPFILWMRRGKLLHNGSNVVKRLLDKTLDKCHIIFMATWNLATKNSKFEPTKLDSLSQSCLVKRQLKDRPSLRQNFFWCAPSQALRCFCFILSEENSQFHHLPKDLDKNSTRKTRRNDDSLDLKLVSSLQKTSNKNPNALCFNQSDLTFGTFFSAKFQHFWSF